MASVAENPTSTGDASTRTKRQNLATSKVLHHVPNNDEPGEDTTGKDGVNAGEISLEAVTDRDVESTTDEEQRLEATESQEKTARTNEQDAHAWLSGSRETHDEIDDTIISDNEDSDSLERDVRYNVFYKSEPATLRDRVRQAPKRMLHKLAYSQLVEDRIEDLEERVGKIESNEIISDTATEEPSSEAEEPGYEAILGLNVISFEEYKPKKDALVEQIRPDRYKRREKHERQKRDAGTGPPYLIDVVVSPTIGDNVYKDTISKQNHHPGDSTRSTDLISHPSSTESVQYPTPERIRINSTLLLELLERITDQKFTRTEFVEGTELKSQVILRPFKLLVIFEQEIRTHANQLSEQFVPNASGAESPDSAFVHNADSEDGSKMATGATSSPALSKDQKERRKRMIREPVSVEEEKPHESRRCLEELQVLIELLDTYLKATFDLRRQVDKGDLHSISFFDLWHLFRHGQEITSSEGHTQFYRILDITGGRKFLCTRAEADMEELDTAQERVKDIVTFKISCFCYQSDGRRLRPVQHIFHIPKYDQVQRITSLPYYPVEFLKSAEGMYNREYFVSRGRRFVDLAHNTTDVVHKRYDGLTVDLEQLREEVDSQIIIDTAMALLKNPSLQAQFGITEQLTADGREFLEFLVPDCRREGCYGNTAIHGDWYIDEQRNQSLLETKTSIWDVFEGEKNMRPEDFLVCPCSVYGYVLRSRKWASLDVDLVDNIPKGSNGFESLVLPEGHKETLLALVETHSKGKSGQKAPERQIDLVRGKGKGLIILLHGEPGVGKTSTAECVAEHTGRPLFQVTCGDIGETAAAVESTLENHFQLAHRWGCVLLLDEADVFLMRRDKNDLKRNAIVSVFLRVLEYYSGILFLTTNRVGIFDQAFRSRIHMSLFYPKLDQKATADIWKMNLDRTQKNWKDSLTISEKDHKEILNYADEHFKDLEKSRTTWNGRQIRNAFQTAIALAEYDAHQVQEKYRLEIIPKPRLEVVQFQKVAKASRHFDEYIKETAGLEEDLPREHHERRDDLGASDIEKQLGGMKRKPHKSQQSDGA